MNPDYDVIVIGAGPTGQLAATELQRLGLNVAIFERRTDVRPGTRAIGVHAPVLAALETSGITEQILAGAERVTRGVARNRNRVLGDVRFDRLNTRFPFVATVPQAVTEAAVGFGGPVAVRGMHVEAINDLGDRVEVRVRVPVSGPTSGPANDQLQSGHGASEQLVRSAHVVVLAAGSAGANELVAGLTKRRSHTYGDRYLMADVAAAPGEPDGTAVISLDQDGVFESFPLKGGGRRLVAWDRSGARDHTIGHGEAHASEVRAERLRRAVTVRSGGGVGSGGGVDSGVAGGRDNEALAAQITAASEFGVRRALVEQMRIGRVFVIGDAAHEVSPIGGQGMNLGLLDAVTLAPLVVRWARAQFSAAATVVGDLERWETRRRASAHTAARLAAVNTSLGRPRPASMNWAGGKLVTAMLIGPFGRIAAHAYTMGCDRDARASRSSRR